MRTTLDPTLDIVFKLLFGASESHEALISLLTAVLRPARPMLAWTRFLGATSDEEVTEACMSNPAIAKANELLTNLSATPSAQDLAQQRQLALDTYKIEMGAAHAHGKETGRVEGLRAAVTDLAEAFGIELDQARRDEIQRASLDELEALRARLKKERRW